MDKKSKIYVAGHTGMVGASICHKLQGSGYRNIVTRTHQQLDLTRQAEVEQFFARERPEFIFLAAARVGGIWANNQFPAEFIYQNLQIQNNVIHAAHQNKTRKLLFLGSSCIYPRDCPQPMREEYLLSGPLEATNAAYATAKIAGIKMCQSYFTQYGDDFFSIMPTNLYGPHDNFDLNSSHVIPALLRKFHNARVKWEGLPPGDRERIRVSVWGSGKPRREFLYVDDLAEASVYLMNHLSGTDLYSQGITHLNVGTGQDLTIAELCELIREIVQFQGEIVYDLEKPDGTPRKLLDVRRLSKFGWQPEISLREGLERTYDYYKRTGRHDGRKIFEQ